MKKVVSVLVMAVLLTLAAAAGPETVRAETPPAILLDGLPLSFPVPPTIIQDRTMVPFRAIAEALGVTVTWQAETRSIDARGADAEVHLTINDKTALINGFPGPLDVPPLIVNDRTLVPLRFFSEAFGARVGWDGATRTVTVVSPVRTMRTLAFYAIRSFPERQLVSRFSNVAYGWGVLKPDGRVDLTGDTEYRWPDPAGDVTGERLLADAARSGTRRYLMLYATDEKGDYTRLVLDATLVDRAARETAAAVATRGFDGVVLDVEYLGQTEQGAELERVRQGFTHLVQAVAQQLRAAGKETIISVHPLNGAFQGYDYAALAREADLLQVMAHDYIDHRVDQSPEPADKVIEAIDLALAQVGRNRILLGIVAPYETPQSLAQKVGLAKRYGLAGISVWRLGTVGADRMAALELLVIPQK